jgi:hypothetical protein
MLLRHRLRLLMRLLRLRLLLGRNRRLMLGRGWRLMLASPPSGGGSAPMPPSLDDVTSAELEMVALWKAGGFR